MCKDLGPALLIEGRVGPSAPGGAAHSGSLAVARFPFANADQIKLIELDENLVRSELLAAESAIYVAERQRLYEVTHPKTRQGGANGKAGGPNSPHRIMHR